MNIAYIPPGKPDKEPKPKSQSQRLRAVMFLCYQQNNEGFPDFESYYSNKMAWLIQEWTNKLPPL